MVHIYFRPNMKGSYKHEHVSTSTTVTNRVLNGCFLLKETKKGLIHLKAFHVESDSYSFIVTYQPNLQIRHGNLDGHEIITTLQRPDPILELKHSIPKEFLVTEETCVEHVMIILSEMYLPHSIQEHLVHHISTESVNFSLSRRRGGGGGLKVEVDVKVNVEQWVRIRCCCKAKNTCLVPAMDCPICLTELSSEVSRMELRCSHVFHSDCVMTWLKKSPSCPICRTKALGETVSIF